MTTGRTDRTLSDLENDVWDAPPFGSWVVTRSHALRHVPLRDFAIEDLRLMVGQNMSLPLLMPLVVDELERHALAEGDFSPGDLLLSALRVERAFLEANPPIREALLEAAGRARAALIFLGSSTTALDDIAGRVGVVPVRDPCGAQISVDDVVVFSRWNDRLAGLPADDEMRHRLGLDHLFRVVDEPRNGLLTLRRRDVVTGQSVELNVERSSVDFIGNVGCGADLRADLIEAARTYVVLAGPGETCEQLLQRFATLDAFIKSAQLTPDELRHVDGTSRYRLIIDAIGVDATVDQLAALYLLAEGAGSTTCTDLEATAALALHHRAWVDAELGSLALHQLLVVQKKIALIHPHHPVRRFTKEKMVSDAIAAMKEQ